MSTDYFDLLAPELISLIAPSLSTASLNALTLTCQRLREILQPELDARLTPELAKNLLLWAAESNPYTVKKLLAPPHLTNPNSYGFYWETPLHVAAKAGNQETAALLLSAGANPSPMWDQDEYMPLHLATMNNDLGMMTLLLENQADVDACWGCDGASENPLHSACYRGNLEMVKLLVARGASLEHKGHFGTALGFAVHTSKVEVVKLLLDAGANVAVQVPLFVLLNGPGPPPPHVVDLLYLAMRPWHPGSFLESLENYQKSGWELPTGFQRKWKPQPLGAKKKELMAILLAHGANKDATMALVSRHLTALAKEAEHSEDEYLATVRGVLKEAEEAIPEVLEMYK